MKNIETRQLSTELRMVERDGKRHLTGYAAKFNEFSLEINGIREIIAPGAFANSLKNNDVRAFLFHEDRGFPLGRTGSGRLKLKENDEGLLYDLELPDTTDGRDLTVSVDNDDVVGMSFGFMPPHLSANTRDEWSERGTVRTLLEIDLVEISPVNFPAYGNSDFSLALRSRDKWLEENPQEPQEEEPEPATPRKDRAKKLLEIYELSG